MKRLGIGLAAMLAAVLLVYGAAFLYYHAGPAETCRVVARSGGAESSTVRLNRPMGLGWAGGLLYVADTEDGSVDYTARTARSRPAGPDSGGPSPSR